MVCMEIKQGVKLADFSGYRIGGPADYFVEARNVGAVKSALAWAMANHKKYFILAGGTNILFSDEGYRGLVIKVNIGDFKIEGARMTAGASALMADLVTAAVDQGLAGLEWAGGLPGTLGGAIRGNAGCFGGEMKDVVSEVTALEASGREVVFKNSDCGFGYRHSKFKEEKLIVVEGF